jgi:hypothetical protein
MRVPIGRGAASADLPQEFIRRHEEGVLLEDAANDDHRMRSHNVNDDIPAKLGEIVRSDDRVRIPRQNIIQPGLILHQVIDTRPVFQGLFHMGNETSQREPLLSTTL